MKKEQSTVDQLAEIAKTVLQVCCYGGDNKAKPRALAEIISAIVNEVCTQKCIVTQLDSLDLSDAPLDEQAKFVENVKHLEKYFYTYFGIEIADWNKYFLVQADDQTPYTHVNPAVLPKILRSLNALFERDDNASSQPLYLELQKLRDHQLADFKCRIALMTYEWVMRVTSPWQFINTNVAEVIVGNKYSLQEKKEPVTLDDRTLLMKYLLFDLIRAPFIFGYANCQLMAELAFFIAIQNIPCTPLRNVQFQHAKGKYEELNAIIVGDWPKAGCIVLAPWYSETPFEWKGSLNKTPEIDHYNSTNVLFTVKNEKERIHWSKFLQAADFDVNKLLGTKNRAAYIKYIEDKAKELYDLSQAVPQPELQSGYYL